MGGLLYAPSSTEFSEIPPVERPRHSRPLRASLNTLFVLLLGAAIGYSAYPVLNALRSPAPPGDASNAVDTEAPPKALPGEEALDAVIWPGRHLMVGIRGTALDDSMRALLAHVRPGAVILRGENLTNREQILALVDGIKAATGLGKDDTSLPLIVADLGEADVQAMGLQPPPAIATLASIGNMETARRLGRAYAADCAQLGFAMVFSPILDVFSSESFAQNPNSYDQAHAEATKMALAFMAGAREGGLIPIGQGFPGRASAQTVDGSPTPTLNQDRYELAKIMYSFIEAVSGDEKVPALVVEHVAVPTLDDTSRPASLSPVLVQTVLRKTCNYEGVVIAGDVTRDPAIANEPTERVAVQALAAGCDAVIMDDPTPDSILAVCKAIQTAVFLDTLSRDQLDAGKARLDSLQNWLRASDRSSRGETPAQMAHVAPPQSAPAPPRVEDLVPPTESAPPPTVVISKEEAPAAEVPEATTPTDEPEMPSPVEATTEGATVAVEDVALPEPSQPKEHAVAEGESLTGIANQYGVTVKNLLTWNNLIDPQVQPGQVLRIAPSEAPETPDDDSLAAGSAETVSESAGKVKEPETPGSPAPVEPTEDAAPEPEAETPSAPVTTHKVVPGDTLSKIAAKYHTTSARIMELNNMKDANVVVLGSKLKVPAP